MSEKAKNYRELARDLLADPLELITQVLVKHSAALLQELHEMKRPRSVDERRVADRIQREADSELHVATFDFDAHDPEHAKRLLFEAGWIAGAYHARKQASANGEKAG